MKAVHVGLVADPAAPIEIARRLSDPESPGGDGRDFWEIDVVSEPCTTGPQDVDTAMTQNGTALMSPRRRTGDHFVHSTTGQSERRP